MPPLQLPPAEHRHHDWWVRGYAEAEGMELLDLWQYPIEGGADDFPRFLEIHDLGALMRETSVVVKALFALRIAVGRVLRWERGGGALYREVHRDHREQTLRIENRKVAALMHLGWVPLDDLSATSAAGWTAQLAVYARTRGRFGPLYLKAIGPFRHRFVYPSLLRAAARRWKRRNGD